MKTNRAGDVFGAWPDTVGRKIYIVKSTDGGASYSPPVEVAPTFDSYDIGVPSFAGRRALVYVTLGAYKSGAKNNVYATWTDLVGSIRLNLGCKRAWQQCSVHLQNTHLVRTLA